MLFPQSPVVYIRSLGGITHSLIYPVPSVRAVISVDDLVGACFYNH